MAINRNGGKIEVKKRKSSAKDEQTEKERK